MMVEHDAVESLGICTKKTKIRICSKSHTLESPNKASEKGGMIRTYSFDPMPPS